MAGIITSTAEETHNLGRWLAGEVREGMGKRDGAVVIALTGPLGAGKTVFTQGIAEGFGIAKDLQSPTFLLVKEYPIPGVSVGAPATLTHIDGYRLKGPDELFALGFREMLEDSSRIVVMEWAERIRPAIPPDALWVEFQLVGPDRRNIELSMPSGAEIPAAPSVVGGVS